MKIKILFVALLSVVFASCSYERIDAGYEGIKINLYGSDKGVDDVALVTGAVWYNPITTAVYEYPTFVQTVDPTISLKIVDGKSCEVFKKYRQEDITKVINTTLYNYVKNAFRIQLNNYTTDELVSRREEFEKAIEDRLQAELLAENFQLEQMTSGLQYPASLVDAIDAKNAARLMVA